MHPNEDLVLEIERSGSECQSCGKLLYATDSLMEMPSVATIKDDHYVVVIHTGTVLPGNHRIYYRLTCGGSIERGQIDLIVEENVLQAAEDFVLRIIDTESFKAKKPFRLDVQAKGFPQAMVTCSGCKDIEMTETNVYRITPGYAREIDLTISGVTAHGDIRELAVRRLQFP